MFLMQIFIVNSVFADDDVDAVTGAAPRIPVAERTSNAVPQPQISLSLPDSEIGRMMERGISIFFSIIANVWTILLLVLILLTILFYAIFSLGLGHIPIFKDVSGNQEKQRQLRMISMTLAILSSIGLLGYAGFDGNEFNVGNVLERTTNLLNTFGLVGVWFISILFGGIVYFSGKEAKKGMDPGPYPKGAGWGLTLVAFGSSLWLGASLLGNPWALLGALAFFGGLVGLLWPKFDSSNTPSNSQPNRVGNNNSDNNNNTGGSGNNIGGATSSGDTQSGSSGGSHQAGDSNNRTAEDFRKQKKQLESVLKEIRKSRDVKTLIKAIMIRTNFLKRWNNDERESLNLLKKHIDNIKGNNYTPKDIDAVKSLVKGSRLVKLSTRNSRREYRLLKKFKNSFDDIKAILQNIVNKSTSDDFVELKEKAQAMIDLISATENHVESLEKSLVLIQDNIKNNMKPSLDVLEGKSNKLTDQKEKILDIASDIENEIRNLLANLDEAVKYITFQESHLIALKKFVNDLNLDWNEFDKELQTTVKELDESAREQKKKEKKQEELLKEQDEINKLFNELSGYFPSLTERPTSENDPAKGDDNKSRTKMKEKINTCIENLKKKQLNDDQKTRLGTYEVYNNAVKFRRTIGFIESTLNDIEKKGSKPSKEQLKGLQESLEFIEKFKGYPSIKAYFPNVEEIYNDLREKVTNLSNTPSENSFTKVS